MSEKLSERESIHFIDGHRIYLRKLSLSDVTEEYLSWLNDPEVLRYRRPKVYSSTMEDLQTFIRTAQNSQDLYLAICLQEGDKHIGGVSLTAINFVHHTADLNIMIGDKNCWGNGFGKEVVFVLSKHAFFNMGLNRLSAQSPNPAFNKIVKSLGWVHEGTKRQMFLMDGEYIDMECYGLLKSEFKEIDLKV